MKLRTDMFITEWHWEVTRRCNLQCLHCLYGDEPSISEMNQVQSRQSIDRVASLGGRSLKLTGGEPMVREDLSFLIRHAHSVGLKVEMITNGTLLTDQFLDKAVGCLDHVAVSVDGFCKAHDALRGKGAFKMAMSALDRLTSRDIPVSVSVTISAINFPELSNFLRFLAEQDISSIHINDLNMAGRAKQNRHSLGLEWNDRNRQQLFDVLEEACGCTVDNAVVDTACNIEPSTVCLGANGEVFACTEIMMVCREKKIGVLQDTNFKERVQSYYDTTDPTKLRCRYNSYVWPGVSLITQSGQSCPLARGGI